MAEADFPGAVNQWIVFDTDTSDGLGCPGEGTCSAEATPGVLLLTEYIEGSSNNKAIEISNLGGTAIDLDANVYKLTLFGNGSTDPGNAETLTGTLAPGKSLVFHNSGAADAFKIGNASTVTFFNGDDALVLTKDDVVIDRFGKRGEDPGLLGLIQTMQISPLQIRPYVVKPVSLLGILLPKLTFLVPTTNGPYSILIPLMA
ncbi:lamin tail domain-containing protein [Shewanella sp. OMA3-2]|uniref:lamin tail domain-containing protein n=1 Tax=Shewanella sp. OMA3-2 TaxID=2908650 RepID=UPI001F1D5B57|nr:lamin tail domain-containing protein [Shewanella sp. OMA3-2]UJF22588.1 lamin tail domain-containing protein [Shewanella sp. OMA3-2]